MSRWLAIVPLAVLIALGALFGLYALNRDPQVQPSALVGKPMPDLTLPDLATGREIRLRDLTAQGPLIVNFFASWCAPCEIEHPVLMGLKGGKVRILGIAYKDAPTNTAAFLTRLGDPFSTVVVDRQGRAGLDFGVTGVPETYVVGADGVILDKHTGPLSEAAARRLAERAATSAR